MKICIVLGNALDTGGPTAYAKELRAQFVERGHTVTFTSYGPVLRALPSGVRHIGFACKLLVPLWRSEVALGFDTMSVGVPLMIASSITPTPFALRIGGDFVWEQYVERTGNLIKLSRFYTDAHDLSHKERFEMRLTRTVLKRAAKLMFNSAWQKELWHKAYGFAESKAHVLENVYPMRKEGTAPTSRTFVAAGRPLKLKQEALLRRIFTKLASKYPDILLDLTPLPPSEHQARIAGCYAVVLASVSDVAPNTVIDAVTYGKPFICTADTGIKERLEGVGIFVDAEREEALTHAIEQLLNKEEYERAKARVQAFTFVRTWSDVASDALSVLQHI